MKWARCAPRNRIEHLRRSFRIGLCRSTGADHRCSCERWHTDVGIRLAGGLDSSHSGHRSRSPRRSAHPARKLVLQPEDRRPQQLHLHTGRYSSRMGRGPPCRHGRQLCQVDPAALTSGLGPVSVLRCLATAAHRQVSLAPSGSRRIFVHSVLLGFGLDRTQGCTALRRLPVHGHQTLGLASQPCFLFLNRQRPRHYCTHRRAAPVVADRPT